MTAIPPSVQAVLELFRGPLSEVRFADVDASRLASLAAEVEDGAAELEHQESKLAELRQSVAQRQEALLGMATRAVAYARVYAEGDEPLLTQLGSISLPRVAKARKPGSSARAGSAQSSPGGLAEEAPGNGREAAAEPRANERGARMDLGGEPGPTPADEAPAPRKGKRRSGARVVTQGDGV